MGDDYANVHPYVFYPVVSAQTALDMLNSVKTAIQNHYSTNLSNLLNYFQ